MEQHDDSAAGAGLRRWWIPATPELKAAERDRCAPEDFYSTTNQRTLVRIGGQWLEVENQRMDAMVVVRDGRGELPPVARYQGGRSGRGRHEGHPRCAGSEGARSPGVRLHEQRNLFRAPGGDGGGADGRDDAAGAARRQEESSPWPDPVVVHTGGGAAFRS